MAPSAPIDAPLQYPMHLDQAAIAGLIPHRPPMLFVVQATVLAHDWYEGHAVWHADNPLLQGHFPGCAIVPGALVLEAAAQLAGIGLLAGDPIARGVGPGHLGMLAAVRKCFFKRPILPDERVRLQIHCRRMGEKAVLVTGSANVGQYEAASLEFMVAHVPVASLQDILPGGALARLSAVHGK